MKPPGELRPNLQLQIRWINSGAFRHRLVLVRVLTPSKSPLPGGHRDGSLQFQAKSLTSLTTAAERSMAKLFLRHPRPEQRRAYEVDDQRDPPVLRILRLLTLGHVLPDTVVDLRIGRHVPTTVERVHITPRLTRSR